MSADGNSFDHCSTNDGRRMKVSRTPAPDLGPTINASVAPSLSLFLWYLTQFKMRVQSLIKAQSLATSSLRTAARTASRTPSRCALSTAAASRTPFTSGVKTDTWINNQQRRWQSAAAQVYVQLSISATYRLWQGST